MNIHYHFEDVERSFETAPLSAWLKKCGEKLELQQPDLTYIFCSDSYILQINRESLDHDYYTDIITFDNRLQPTDEIFADFFISIDTVKSNAAELNLDFQEELKRVMIHGVLHLCGFNDKTEADQAAMREKENEMLALF